MLGLFITLSNLQTLVAQEQIEPTYMVIESTTNTESEKPSGKESVLESPYFILNKEEMIQPAINEQSKEVIPETGVYFMTPPKK